MPSVFTGHATVSGPCNALQLVLTLKLASVGMDWADGASVRFFFFFFFFFFLSFFLKKIYIAGCSPNSQCSSRLTLIRVPCMSPQRRAHACPRCAKAGAQGCGARQRVRDARRACGGGAGAGNRCTAGCRPAASIVGQRGPRTPAHQDDPVAARVLGVRLLLPGASDGSVLLAPGVPRQRDRRAAQGLVIFFSVFFFFFFFFFFFLRGSANDILFDLYRARSAVPWKPGARSRRRCSTKG
jgi:hypothetical protein